jgi:hypothetical protein
MSGPRLHPRNESSAAPPAAKAYISSQALSNAAFGRRSLPRHLRIPADAGTSPKSLADRETFLHRPFQGLPFDLPLRD